MQKKQTINVLIIVVMLVIISLLTAVPAGFEEKSSEINESEAVSGKTDGESPPFSPNKDQEQPISENTDVPLNLNEEPDTGSREISQ